MALSVTPPILLYMKPNPAAQTAVTSVSSGAAVTAPAPAAKTAVSYDQLMSEGKQVRFQLKNGSKLEGKIMIAESTQLYIETADGAKNILISDIQSTES